MLSVDEALQKVVQSAGRQPVVRAPLDQATGLVLAEAVVSDLDSPPFTKSLMDGFAVRSVDLAGGEAQLRILGEVTAGKAADRPVEAGSAYQIMTGAPLPPGADSVVMIERAEIHDNTVTLRDPSFRPGQNVMRQGRELQRGQVVLEPGVLLGSPEIGLLATVGCTRPNVYQRPKIALLSTGDEIVPPDRLPNSNQIRNSNGSTLWSLATCCGCEVVDLGIVQDDPNEIRRRVSQGLQCDLLLLTGGVSAGTRDYVPQVLAEAGVRQVFHQVALKPGKPVWFGVHDGGLVFGLPGNPVSVLVCFELFVRTALRARQNFSSPLPAWVQAKLAEDFAYPTRRETFHPAKLSLRADGLWVSPTAWFGSPDLRALTEANALLRCPATDLPRHAAGAAMTLLPLTRPLGFAG